MCVGNDGKQSLTYELMPNSTGVHVVCTFRGDNPATGCVAVVHQRISLLTSNELMTIDSHTFTRSDDTASGFIEGVNLEDYQIGVIEISGQVTEPELKGMYICILYYSFPRQVFIFCT